MALAEPAPGDILELCDSCDDLRRGERGAFYDYDEPAASGDEGTTCEGCKLLHTVIEPLPRPIDGLTLIRHENMGSECLLAVLGYQKFLLLHTIEGIPNPWNLDLFKDTSQSSVASLGDLGHVRHWLRRCTESHPECGYPADTVLPTRILDLGTDTASLIRLRESSGLCGRYICLSYCWGGSSFTKTTPDNLESHRRGIRLEDLPQTFQDTIQVARALNVQYVWIDALCIIQQDDNNEDWKRECGNMANIYRNAYLTVSATWANSPTLGLFPKHREDCRSGPIVARIIHHFSEDATLERSIHFPVLGRAWTFQERMLSTRVLHFGSDEIYWECMSLHTCKCGKAEIVHFDASKTAFSDAISNFRSNSTASPDTIWRFMVEQYTALQLSCATDKLPAFSGIANEMQQDRGLEYLAGLWRDTLVQDLCWRVALPEDEKPSVRTPRRRPTWSWASVDVPVRYSNYVKLHSRELELLVEVLDARCSLEGPSATGPVKGGFIELECALIPVYFENDEFRTSSRILYSFDFHAKCEDQENVEYYRIPLWWGQIFHMCGSGGIIVTPKNPQELTRVGMYEHTCYKQELTSLERQKVRIV